MRLGQPHSDHRGHRVNGMARSAYHSQVPHRRRLSASVAQDQIFPHLVCAPSDLLGDVAQTHLLGTRTPHQRSLFDIEMGGQWISSGWTLHQWSLIERCAHPRHPRIRMGGDRTLPNDAPSRTRWRSHDRCATESGNVHIGRHPRACRRRCGDPPRGFRLLNLQRGCTPHHRGRSGRDLASLVRHWLSPWVEHGRD